MFVVVRIEFAEIFDTIHILRHAGGYMVIAIKPNGTICHCLGPDKGMVITAV